MFSLRTAITLVTQVPACRGSTGKAIAAEGSVLSGPPVLAQQVGNSCERAASCTLPRRTGGTCGVQALPGRSTRSAQLKCHTQYPCSRWLGDALQRAKPKAISARSSSLADTGRRSHGSVQTSGNRGQIPPQTATQVSLRPSQRQGLPAVGPATLQGAAARRERRGHHSRSGQGAAMRRGPGVGSKQRTGTRACHLPPPVQAGAQDRVVALVLDSRVTMLGRGRKPREPSYGPAVGPPLVSPFPESKPPAAVPVPRGWEETAVLRDYR